MSSSSEEELDELLKHQVICSVENIFIKSLYLQARLYTCKNYTCNFFIKLMPGSFSWQQLVIYPNPPNYFCI